jgi:MOSC domain-containing protein YiiM
VQEFVGEVVGIYVASAAGRAMEARTDVRAIAGGGLDGDRYASRTGTYSQDTRVPRDVTLIEREAVDAVRGEGIALAEADTRRNVVTAGVPLNHLVGRTFRVGDVLLRGVKLAEPCVYLEQLLGVPGVRASLVHRGGLRAEILTGGELRVGDAIAPVAPVVPD